MNNDEVFYPDRKLIEAWIEFLKNESLILKLKLPVTDNDWFQKVLDTLDRVKMPYSASNLNAKAALLFYYLDKDHNFIDGNKRTAIVLTYLLYIVNGYKITDSKKIERLAKKVARSRGSSKKDNWLQKIEKEFSECIKNILK